MANDDEFLAKADRLLVDLDKLAKRLDALEKGERDSASDDVLAKVAAMVRDKVAEQRE
jgi:hypothetical protein